LENELTKIFALRPTGLAYDSRRVQPGFVFFAVKGFQDDGHLYVRDAVQRGAVGVVVERPVAVPPPVGVVRVSNVRRALALAAARFYGHPAERLHMVGVTGTNGKTTTTHLISAVLRAQGKKAGLIGTLYNKIGDKIVPGERTTPESLDLQALLRRMVDEGVEAVAMEVSSHALALERVTGIEFDVAVFTNLTQDHLDFHHDLEDYFAAKARLFAALEEPGIKSRPKAAVLNIDDPYGRRLVSLSGGAVTYGIENPADVRARDVVLTAGGTSFEAETPWGRASVNLKLAGRFNVYNALAAFAVGGLEGLPPDEVARALEDAPAVPGRFERIEAGQDFTVVVDYAHTPDGLASVLQTARALSRGRLIVVFGCGGDRDPIKRPVMGGIAGRLADFTVITSDNPRREDPLAIIAAIEAGIRSAGVKRYVIEPDRREAIRIALRYAQPGDLVVLAGKGHEDYQIIGDQKLPFDDRKVATAILKEMAAEKSRGVKSG
jgi:UDP-N-acetylmuramoyl-L-alanyl-D-glutamate--2,6-diaminopimelate ligase